MDTQITFKQLISIVVGAGVTILAATWGVGLVLIDGLKTDLTNDIGKLSAQITRLETLERDGLQRDVAVKEEIAANLSKIEIALTAQGKDVEAIREKITDFTSDLNGLKKAMARVEKKQAEFDARNSERFLVKGKFGDFDAAMKALELPDGTSPIFISAPTVVRSFGGEIQK